MPREAKPTKHGLTTSILLLLLLVVALLGCLVPWLLEVGLLAAVAASVLLDFPLLQLLLVQAELQSSYARQVYRRVEQQQQVGQLLDRVLSSTICWRCCCNRVLGGAPGVCSVSIRGAGCCEGQQGLRVVCMWVTASGRWTARACWLVLAYGIYARPGMLHT